MHSHIYYGPHHSAFIICDDSYSLVESESISP